MTIKRTGRHETRLGMFQPAIYDMMRAMRKVAEQLSDDEIAALKHSAESLTDHNCAWYMKEAQTFISEALREAPISRTRAGRATIEVLDPRGTP